MPVNDFEKSVQQKMEGFQLTPSASVWNGVKERIQLENKRRRRIIFWWALPLLITGTVAVIYLGRPDKKANTQISSAQTEESKASTLNNPGSEVEQPAAANTPAPDNAVNNIIPLPSVKDNTTVHPPAGDTRNIVAGNSNKRPSVVSAKKKWVQEKNDYMVTSSGNGSKTKRNTAAAENNERDAVVKTTKSAPLRPVDNLPVDANEKTDDHIILTADDSGPVINRPDITVVHQDVADLTVKKPKVKEPVVKTESPLVRISKKDTWETGLAFGLGVAARTNSVLAGSAEKSLNQYNSGGLTVPNSPVYAPPGALLGRSLFQAGLYTRKQISERTAFSTGLQFANYSTKQETGMFIDSILVITSSRSGYVRADGFYRSGKTYIFNNRYFLVQMPLSFELQLGKGRELPFNWINGFTPALMAGSNSLVYNSTNGTYYKDKTAYNSFQLFYHTGFSARFGADTRHPVTAGISLDYALTGLHKNSSTEKNNLMSFGFQLKYALKK